MKLFNRIEELLAHRENFVVAVITKRSGSAPRSVGSKMVICQNGSIAGSIGGGLLEAQVRDLAMEVFGHRKPVFREFSFTAEEAAEMCMICGGSVEVLVHLVDASQSSNLVLYQQIAAALRSRERAWLVTEIPPSGEEAAQRLIKSDGTFVGPLGPGITQEPLLLTSRAELVSHEGSLFFVEPLSLGGSAFIFGAGHISQMLAPLTRLVGFRTIVVDDRKEFANRERFETADEVIVAESFERAMNDLEIDEESYLVLVSRGHTHDKTLLRQALRTNAGYIGMIGSRRKRDAVYDALRKEGFSKNELGRVFSPIGLDIGAETPEEIAVSIVAELIKIRAGKNR